MRVRRTFFFLDLCGFTSFTDEHGDQEAVAVLGHLRAVLRAEAENHGVRVTKWLGDGAMLSGVETADVVTCVADVVAAVREEGELPLRAGICAGRVIMFEGDDYIGAAVNVAARLCQSAEAGQVIITAGAVAELPAEMSTRELAPMTLPGITELVEVCELFVDPTAAERGGASPRM